MRAGTSQTIYRSSLSDAAEILKALPGTSRVELGVELRTSIAGSVERLYYFNSKLVFSIYNIICVIAFHRVPSDVPLLSLL